VWFLSIAVRSFNNVSRKVTWDFSAASFAALPAAGLLLRTCSTEPPLLASDQAAYKHDRSSKSRVGNFWEAQTEGLAKETVREPSELICTRSLVPRNPHKVLLRYQRTVRMRSTATSVQKSTFVTFGISPAKRDVRDITWMVSRA